MWAVCSHAVGVGATDQGDLIAPFSQQNASVDISAPGVSVVSTFRDPNGNHGYRALDGTSQANAHVSGCAALVLSLNSTLNPDQVEQVLRNSALDLGAPGRDDVY